MTGIDWLHCNQCYLIATGDENNSQFFVSSCGQVVCGRCTDGSSQKCLFHDHDCCYSPLGTLKREHEALFTNIIQMLNKNLKYLDFQMNQYGSLLNYLKTKLVKYNANKQEIASLKSECRRHRDEKNNLKNELIKKHDEIQTLKNEIDKLQRRSTPHTTSGYFSEPSGSRTASNYLFGANSKNQQLSFSPIADNNSSIFTPPKPVTYAFAYRENSGGISPKQTNSMVFQSPPTEYTTPSSARAKTRSVLLPGDKGSSPLSRIGLQRLNIKCTPNFDRGSSQNNLKNQRRTRPGVFGASKYNSYL